MNRELESYHHGELTKLRLFYERVMAKRDEWRETAIVIATPAAIAGLVGHDTEQMGKGLYYCAADIDAIAKEVGSE